MGELKLLENTVHRAKGKSPTGTVPLLNWKDSPSVQHLLDAICSILAEEYIMIAKQNPSVFIENAPGKMGQSPSGTVPIFPLNDERKK